MARSGWWLIRIACALVICAFLWLLLNYIVFGGGATKFTHASMSSRSARWGGRHVHDAQLEVIESNDPQGAFMPREAWIETAYENVEGSFPYRKKVAGIRLCVRFEISPALPSIGRDVRTTINGITPEGQGRVSNKTGVTFEVLPDPNETIPVLGREFPPEGELTFTEQDRGREVTLRYVIKK
jgi:hypothetical protein